MVAPSILDENWKTLTSLFPANWQELGRSTNATGRLRGFEDGESLLRVLLVHIAMGYSLRETAAIARQSGLAETSDVALLKRLRKCEPWLRELALELMREIDFASAPSGSKIDAQLVDATIVKEPGKTGSQWRIHYSLSIPSLSCEHFELTPTEGEGNGETLKRFPFEAGKCVIADRAYSRASDLEHVHASGAFAIVRVNWNALPLRAPSGERFELLDAVGALGQAGMEREWETEVTGPSGLRIRGRICAVRKSRQAIDLAIKKLKRNASKRQTKIDPRSLEFAKYVIVFSTLSRETLTTKEILEWYRYRWQVELLFKRFKSLAGLGHLPKHSDSSSRAWLYGKLFVSLLSEKLVRYASELSPWGYPLEGQSRREKPVEGVRLPSGAASDNATALPH